MLSPPPHLDRSARDEGGTPSLPAALVRDLASAMSSTELFEILARWIPSIVGTQRASIAIADRPMSDVLRILNIGADLIIMRGTVLDVTSSIVGKGYQTKQTLRVGDLTTERAADAQLLAAAGLHSALVCPLVSGGECFGTINIASTQPNFYQDHDEELMESIAALVASFLRIQKSADRASMTAITDDLTGQLNRRGIMAHLEQVTKPGGVPTSALFIDLDDLKSINDAYGHSTGDRVITIVERRIASRLAEHELVGRLGGDEFLVVLPDDEVGSVARQRAKELVDVCTEKIRIRDLTIVPRISVGIATALPAVDAAERLLAEADIAMYSAKNSTQAIAVVDESTRQRVLTSAAVDRDLNDSLASGAVRFHYQPVVSLISGEIVGAEALLRWTHPVHGSIPPPTIIERIEATGRINLFSKWSIDTIAQDLVRIRAAAPIFADLPVSLNLSPRQLGWDRYTDNHLAALELNRLCPKDIIVEVVESAEIRSGEAAEATLRRLGEAGARIALDDFGTGHNALRYFAMFPIHGIKFDRSLVGLVYSSHESRVILKGLSTLAHELDISTLAEGVETAAEAQICGDLGVLEGQGWHFGRPMPLDDLVRYANESPAPQITTHRQFIG